MKLHGSAISPFVQRVLIVARHKGLDLPLVPVRGLDDPDFVRISPTRRMPTLEENDGWTMVESAAIVDYLEDTQPGPSVVPVDARDAARARMIAAILDVEFGPAIAHFVKQKWMRLMNEPVMLDYARSRMRFGLESIARIGVDDGPWLVGGGLSLADAALYPMLVLGDLMEESSDSGPLFRGNAVVDAWRARADETEMAHTVAADMRASFEKIFAKRMQA